MDVKKEKAVMNQASFYSLVPVLRVLRVLRVLCALCGLGDVPGWTA
jgi:hypothetical protein